MFIPRTTIDGVLAINPTRGWGLRVRGLIAPSDGAVRAFPTELPRPNRGAVGIGIGIQGRIFFAEDRHSIDMIMDFLSIDLPAFTESMCVEHCEGVGTAVTTSESPQAVGVFSYALGWTWQVEHDVRLRWTAGMRNHPTNIRDVTSTDPVPDLSGGPAYWIIGAGAQWQLSDDHDGGGILGNLAGLLANPQIGNGAGILGHLFGGKTDAVSQGLGSATGLPRDKMMLLLTVLAPIVLGVLGKMRQQRQMGAPQLQKTLSAEKSRVQEHLEQQAPRWGKNRGLDSILDRDGDGKIADDIADMVPGLGSLFGRK